MVFWGIEITTRSPFTLSIAETRRKRLKITQACLGHGALMMKSILKCRIGERSPIFLCNLVPGTAESCPLDLEFFEEPEDVVFSVHGLRLLPVYLSGYYVTGNDSKIHDGDKPEEPGQGKDEQDDDNANTGTEGTGPGTYGNNLQNRNGVNTDEDTEESGSDFGTEDEYVEIDDNDNTGADELNDQDYNKMETHRKRTIEKKGNNSEPKRKRRNLARIEENSENHQNEKKKKKASTQVRTVKTDKECKLKKAKKKRKAHEIDSNGLRFQELASGKKMGGKIAASTSGKKVW